MRILVCGGRTYGKVIKREDPADVLRARKEATKVRETLERVCAGPFRPDETFTLIHGAAAGADKVAAAVAIELGWAIESFKAQWMRWGTAAGPIRNRAMIDRGKPDLVIAFPGGRGTEDMVTRAERAGIPVRRVT